MMKKLFKRGMCLLLFLSFPLFSPMSSYAYGLTISQLDYIRYADENPDLYQAFGYNRDQLYSHYSLSGKKEGRLGHLLNKRPERQEMYSLYHDGFNLDTERYARDNPDVAAVLGNDPEALTNHYYEFGYDENRKAFGRPYQDRETEAKNKVFDVAARITNDSMTDREKIKAVHDWICSNTEYDHINYERDTIPQESYHIEGIMLNGTGVCNGYAETFDYFMYVLGIQSEMVIGNTVGGLGDGGHAWNRVLLDDTWLYVDCTWDDPVPDGGPNSFRYKYFLCTEKEISEDHFAEGSR